MKIYIAGKVTGEKIHECTMKFGEAQKKLEALGHEAINPLQVVNDWHATWQDAMRKCIVALMGAEAVLFLPDSELSKGARLENHIAEAMELKVFYHIKEVPNENHTRN